MMGMGMSLVTDHWPIGCGIRLQDDIGVLKSLARVTLQRLQWLGMVIYLSLSLSEDKTIHSVAEKIL